MKPLWALGALLVLAFVGGCSKKELPRSRPETRMFDRSMSQSGMVEVVVTDRARAARVSALYDRIERAFLRAESERARLGERALGQSSAGEPTDEEMRAALARMSDVGAEVYAEYVSAQLALRRELTEDEFRRLNGVR